MATIPFEEEEDISPVEVMSVAHVDEMLLLCGSGEALATKLLPYKNGCCMMVKPRPKCRAARRRPRPRKCKPRRRPQGCKRRKPRRRACKPRRPRKRACRPRKRVCRSKRKAKRCRSAPVTTNGYLNFLRWYRRCNCHLTEKQALVAGTKKWLKLSKRQRCQFERLAEQKKRQLRQRKQGCKPKRKGCN